MKIIDVLFFILMKILGWLSLKSCLHMIKSQKSEERFRAVKGLGRLCDFPVRVPLPPLIKALQDEDSKIRNQAVRSINWLGYTGTAFEDIVNSLKDEDSEVRGSAVYALRTQPRALPILVNMFKDQNSKVRECAVEAVGNLGEEKVTSILIEALQDEAVQVRRQAASSLKYFGDESAIPALKRVQETDYARIWEGVPGHENGQDITMSYCAKIAIEEILERTSKKE